MNELLLGLADDELVIGWRDSEWTGIAPLLEEDVAFSSIAQNEIGHARAVYERWGFQPSELTLAVPVEALQQRLSVEPEGKTFGIAHVQTDDAGSVEADQRRRDARGQLRASPGGGPAHGAVRLAGKG